MTPEIISVIIQFMMRVQLSGHEVPAFNTIMAALQDAAISKE